MSGERPAILGCLFLVPSLAWLSAITWIRVRHIRPLDWEPTALLMREVHSGNPTARQVALAELFGVCRNFHTEQISRIADDALAQQANEQTIWQPEWGNFLKSHTSNGSFLQPSGENTLRKLSRLR